MKYSKYAFIALIFTLLSCKPRGDIFDCSKETKKRYLVEKSRIEEIYKKHNCSTETLMNWVVVKSNDGTDDNLDKCVNELNSIYGFSRIVFIKAGNAESVINFNSECIKRFMSRQKL
jgi:hypothetical protein